MNAANFHQYKFDLKKNRGQAAEIPGSVPLYKPRSSRLPRSEPDRSEGLSAGKKAAQHDKPVSAAGSFRAEQRGRADCPGLLSPRPQ